MEYSASASSFFGARWTRETTATHAHRRENIQAWKTENGTKKMIFACQFHFGTAKKFIFSLCANSLMIKNLLEHSGEHSRFKNFQPAAGFCPSRKKKAPPELS
eukprot:gnl/Spiro4/12430_TR6566_c0_g2_i1.p1 gnl/Spiro4/12430_TR6566_c0_g2~~gnl/Spiro4/12430_TR6566_c0_g2_i1.p1  ORF type:complete len:103 (+),score=1.14 gnl/Spiro4/12430_TR6566_c0_g2_i1:48-356(+)